MTPHDLQSYYTISLLHATYRAGSRALEVRQSWLSRAVNPDLIEHIFALDEDDIVSVTATEGYRRVIGPRNDGVTAVRNWNAAGSAATGDLMFVIADDLLPPNEWDETLRHLVAPLDPATQAFAVKVKDDNRSAKDVLLRHPVISRAFYMRYGLWSPAFRGVYSDDDLTIRAFWAAFILDGRALELDHLNPAVTSVGWSPSHRRINAQDEYYFGEMALKRSWDPLHRTAEIYLVRPGSSFGSARRSTQVKRLVSVWRYEMRRIRHGVRRLST